MADYYYGEKSAPKSRRGVWTLLLDFVMLTISLVAALVLLVTYCVPYINPSVLRFLSVVGVVAPITYITVLICALYWTLRWRVRRAAALWVLFGIGLFSVSLFWRVELRREYSQQEYDKSAINIMSYNIRQFYNGEGKSSAGDVVDMILEQEPDIVCLQEYNAPLIEREPNFALLDERYEIAHFRSEAGKKPYEGVPQAILSRHPIISRGDVVSENTAAWVDCVIDKDTVRIYNLHLKSTQITTSDREYITTQIFDADTLHRNRIKSIVGRLYHNSVVRAEQVDRITAHIAQSPHPVVVCGDFNDTPISYAYKELSNGLKDAFRAQGVGYSHTFDGFFNVLRIDYVLLSPRFETISYETPDVEHSDHLPVVVRFKITEKDS